MAEPTKPTTPVEPRKFSGRIVLVNMPTERPLNAPTVYHQIIEDAYARKHGIAASPTTLRVKEIVQVQGIGISVSATIGRDKTARTVDIVIPWASIGSVETVPA